jgi:hypothetical protein
MGGSNFPDGKNPCGFDRLNDTSCGRSAALTGRAAVAGQFIRYGGNGLTGRMDVTRAKRRRRYDVPTDTVEQAEILELIARATRSIANNPHYTCLRKLFMDDAEPSRL